MADIMDFKEKSNTVVNVLINGKKYALKRYTIAQEIRVKKAFDNNLKEWQEGLNNMDGETLIKTLWIFLEDKSDFKQWIELADVMSGDVNEKMNILEAISVCITAALPEVNDAVKKRSAQARQTVLKTLQSLPTGQKSTISSQKNTGGRVKKSKTARTTK